MAMTKLTLSADKDTVQRAKRWAAERNTSLSAAVGKFLKALVENGAVDEQLTPRTQRALGMVKLPDKPYKELLVEALLDKYERRGKK